MSLRFTLALTGASGSAFGVAALRRLAAHGAVARVDLLVSAQGIRCLAHETGLAPRDLEGGKARWIPEDDLGADLASGSHLQDGMAIVPCSAGTLGRIAAGTSPTLIARAADVCLKERRPLVLCLRETPLNRIHLENLLRVHDAGAIVMPLCPAFYTRPNTLEELADAFATRVLDQLGLRERDDRRWQGFKGSVENRPPT